MLSGYSKGKWNGIYLIVCYINIIEPKIMNCTGIVSECYYGIHNVSRPLQELNSLAIDSTNQLLFGKVYKRTEKNGLSFKLCAFPSNHHEKTLLMFEIIAS